MTRNYSAKNQFPLFALTITRTLMFFGFFWLLSLTLTSHSYALTIFNCSRSNLEVNFSVSPSTFTNGNSGSINYTVTNVSGTSASDSYYINMTDIGSSPRINGNQMQIGSIFSIDIESDNRATNNRSIVQFNRVESGGDEIICSSTYTFQDQSTANCNISIDTNPIDVNTNFNVTVSGLSDGAYILKHNNSLLYNFPILNGSSIPLEVNIRETEGQTLNVIDAHSNTILCSKNIYVCESLPCTPPPEDEWQDQAPPFVLCNSIPSTNTAAYDSCEKCLGLNGIWTAVGCVRFGSKEFIEDILKLAIGIAGGISLLLIIFGAFKISISGGDPKAAQSGKEVISGALAGLLIIIFSVVILNLIGVEILKIPGL